jgi:hypothetical protein
VESSRNTQKLMEFARRVTDDVRCFDSIILTREQELPYDRGILSNLGVVGSKDSIKVTTTLPYIRAIQEHALLGKVYVRDATIINKKYGREMNKLVKSIIQVG